MRDDAGAKYLYWHKSEPIGRGWMGDIDIDPFNPGRAMYVTGAGLWATNDATAADSDQPTHWTFLDRGLEETVIKGLVSPPAGPPLLSAMGDLCGFRHDDLSEPSKDGMFDNPLCGSASGIDVAWSKPDDCRARRLGQQPEVGRLSARRRQDLDAVQDDAEEGQGRD